MTQIFYVFIIVFLRIIVSSDSQDTDACQAYPSEYAYHEDSVNRAERDKTKCMNYPISGESNVGTENYIQCDGAPLILTDSDFGSKHYRSGDYYMWTAGTRSQLLFIFPTIVNLTTITLHYYSDSDRGLFRLRFYAVPDDFDVWDAPLGSYSHENVPAVQQDGKPAGIRSVRINTNFTTRKILMIVIYSNELYMFAVSEVTFFKCSGEITNSMAISTSDLTDLSTTNQEYMITTIIYISTSTNIYHNATTTTQDLVNFPQTGDTFTIPLAAGIATVLILLVVTLILVVLLLLWHKRRNTKVKTNSNFEEQEAAYSTLDRETKHFSQPQPLNVSVDLYDQIQLSPSTGQSEVISKTECETNYSRLQDSNQIDKNCASENNYELLETETANPGYLTYAVVDKKKKKSKREESKQSQEDTSERDISHKNPKSLTYADPLSSNEVEKQEDQQCQRKENLEEMYAVVHKKPKACDEHEEIAPTVPSYTVEALYTAVQKKPPK